jgi:hypothetical protein
MTQILTPLNTGTTQNFSFIINKLLDSLKSEFSPWTILDILFQTE